MINPHDLSILARTSSIIFLIIILWLISKRLRPLDCQNLIFLILCSFYPIAKFCQAWLVGPSFIRWYFANIGGIPIVVLILAIFHKNYNEKIIRQDSTIGLILVVIYELLQLAYNSTLASSLFNYRRGDWIDLAIYPIIYGTMLLLTKVSKKTKLS